MLIRLGLLLILLTGIACSNDAPKFPGVQLFETARNPENQELLCGEYKITDPKNFKFVPVVDHPISMCEGVFGFKAKDFPAILDWANAVEKYYKDKLEKCENSK